jgi:hypothetical protein
LYDLAENRRPFVAELAADIFMGRLTETFDQATLCAGRLLRGTLYERYYGLDYDGFSLQKARKKEPLLMDFVRTHRQRDPMPSGSYVVENGTLIERIMIHTTHNLATLVEAGVAPEKPFAVLAVDALSRVLRELRVAAKSSWPLAHVKNAAYAWRQALFFLTLAPENDREGFLAAGEAPAARRILEQAGRSDLFAGLRRALDGASLDEPGAPRRFLGWMTR